MECKRCPEGNVARWQVLDRETGSIVDICLPCIVDMMAVLVDEVADTAKEE